jgi:hypothetical protein
MSMRPKIGFVLSLLVLVIGVCLDSEHDRASGDCDSQCHPRFGFKFCDSGKCVQYDFPNCLLCPGWQQYRLCVTGNGFTTECNDTGQGTSYIYYTSCSELCECSGTTLSSEANMGGTWYNPGLTSYYWCAGYQPGSG